MELRTPALTSLPGAVAPDAVDAADAAGVSMPALPRRVRWLWSTAMAVALATAGCGGGGGGSGTDASAPSPSPVAAPTPAPTTPPATAPTPEPTPPAPEPTPPAPEPTPPAPPAEAPPPAPAPAPAPGPAVIAPVRTGLVHPWSLAFLPDGSMLVTERPGRLRHLSADGSVMSTPITGLPDIFASTLSADPPLQAGLFDVVLDPAFATNRRIYLSYVEGGSAGSGLAVWRGELSADLGSLVNGRVIYRQRPKVADERNYGGRLLFDSSGALLVTLGDRFSTDVRDQAQDPASGIGKIARITTDGAPAPGNPWAAGGGAPEMWSFGHRNPQGLAFHPATGQLWEAEHGPQGGDEINLVQPGLNYGWPKISYGCEYGALPVESCPPVGGATALPGLEQPLSYWVPLSIAPGGISFYTGDKFPEWQGNLFVAALKDMAVWRLTLDGTTVTARERLFGDLGKRVRDVRQGPDGWLYLITDEDNGQILRVQR